MKARAVVTRTPVSRRLCLASLCGIVAFPAAGWSQTEVVPKVGFLVQGLGQSGAFARFVDALRHGLSETGFVDGRNVNVAIHTAAGQPERLSAVASELVSSGPAVMFTVSNVGAAALKAASSSIPIVFVVGIDPVAMKLVESIDRPGGNATGIAFGVSELEPKRMELVRELVPGAKRIAALLHPDNPNAALNAHALQNAARTFAIDLTVLHARDLAGLDGIRAKLADGQAGALLVTSDPFFDAERERLVALAANLRLPAIYPWREFVDAGGLVSYGNDLVEAVRLAGTYVGRILKGARPRDLPVWMPTRFSLILNLRAARTLGLAIPPALLARADEVIE